jgi:Flp pilus assembly protein TadG
LVLPVLIGLVWGVFSFGRGYGAYLVVAAASRDGARMAALGRDDQEVRDVVFSDLASTGIASAAATVSISGQTGIPGDPVTVQVVAAIENPAPLPGLPACIALTSATTMRKE